ncbi:MAG: peptidylprolyl isomerase [Vicinamibacterales bacterium]
MNRHVCLVIGAAALTLSACASAPPAPVAPRVTPEEKLGWILRLEDRRVLSDATLAAPVVPAPPPRRGAPAPAFVPSPDLFVLARDPEASVRRRVALAIGRVGLVDGLPALSRLLQDAEPDVRAMAAFATGLIASLDGVPSVSAALADPSPLVRGRAAEALGIICTPLPPATETPCESLVAPAIAALAEPHIPAAAAMAGDTETAATPEADAWRLAAYALVRIRDWDSLSRITLADGKPVTTWWPVAYALQRINNAAAMPALAELARTDTVTAAAFAIRGLADRRAGQFRELFASMALDETRHVNVRIAAVRALGTLGGADSSAALVKLLDLPALHDNLRLEIVSAIGAAGHPPAVERVRDVLSDDWPVMRATALGVVARLDPENFTFVLSSLGPDPDWSVRAALARLVASLPQDVAAARIEELWKDPDSRVRSAALAAAVRAKLPEAESWIKEALQATDAGLRSAAVAQIRQLRPAWGAAALRDAYAAWANDADESARGSALDALSRLGADAARETLVAALSDRDWAVRLRARALLADIDAAAAPPGAIRPVPNTWPDAVYDDPFVVSPASSPRISIDTRHGTIEIDLDPVDAPLTTWNVLDLARKGFYNGVRFHRVVPNFVVQAGEPRDGAAEAGRTIRDELHPEPFLRGTVGMALAGPDTGGSQFFIMHSPAPHLDARYTVFGTVVSGMDVVDRIRQGDVIDRITVR